LAFFKGVFSAEGQKKIDLGTGIPSAPVISQKLIEGTLKGGTPDVYVGVSGGAGEETKIKSSSDIPQVSRALEGAGASTSIIHWKDFRVRP